VQTRYEAVAAGFGGAALPPFVRRDLEGYLGCGLLCRRFLSAVPLRQWVFTLPHPLRAPTAAATLLGAHRIDPGSVG
jgi:hypothetical protein